MSMTKAELLEAVRVHHVQTSSQRDTRAERAEIESQVQEYLSRGGTIQQLSPGDGDWAFRGRGKFVFNKEYF